MNLSGCRTSGSQESHADRMSVSECIYVIGPAGSSLVKIGRTAKLANRLAALQRMSPFRLTVMWTHPGGHELETNLHRHFGNCRSHGEWFDFGEDDPVQCVREAVEAQPWIEQSRREQHGLVRVDRGVECRECGHTADLHAWDSRAPRRGSLCRVVFGDSDCGCTCSGLVPGRVVNRPQEADLPHAYDLRDLDYGARFMDDATIDALNISVARSRMT